MRKFPSTYNALVSLSAAFNSFNPLQLHPVINLLGNYSARPSKREGVSRIWNELLHPFFNQEQVFPVFEREEPITITQGEKIMPLRQFIQVAGDVPVYSYQVSLDAGRLRGLPLYPGVTSILQDSAGLLFVPTDIISMSVLFQSKQLVEFLENYNAKITLLFPDWPDNTSIEREKNLLDNNVFINLFNCSMASIKNCIDTLILDVKNANIIQDMREITKCTVFATDLSPEHQKTDEFFDTVLKTMSLDREMLKIDRTREKERLSEHLTTLLKKYQ